jgi:transcriptional antiterminator NusG
MSDTNPENISNQIDAKSLSDVQPVETPNTERHGFDWFVLQTLSNQEQKVVRYLTKFRVVDEMEDYFDEILMPTETVSEVKDGKKRSVVRKFYPGYVFVHMKLFGEDGKVMQKPWYFIQKTEGVIGFAGGENPQPLKKEEIDRIKSQMKASEGVEKPKVEYAVGQELRINDGPFLNLTGKVISIAPDTGKLTLAVSIFGRMTPVELEYWQVSVA